MDSDAPFSNGRRFRQQQPCWGLSWIDSDAPFSNGSGSTGLHPGPRHLLNARPLLSKLSSHEVESASVLMGSVSHSSAYLLC